MVKLNSKQVKLLKKEAHHLEPVVHLGKQGMSDALIQTVDEALTTHELIKLKFIDYKSSRKEISRDLAKQLKAILVTVIGNNAVLYRISEDPDKRRYLKSYKA